MTGHPSWCPANEALDPQGNFHERQIGDVQVAEGPGRDGDVRVQVHVTRFQSADQTNPTYISLTSPSNTGSTDVTELTVEEALRLAGVLVTAALTASGES
jgi:hypothetical protein